jgi:PAS domain S-box-containing protein
MQSAEEERLAELLALEVLDTGPEAPFDRITALAADLFGAPIALISLADRDRNWFKSRHGMEAEQAQGGCAFCAEAIAQGPHGQLVVPDAAADARFSRNPFVIGDLGVRFYAGAALTTASGHNLGVLCVIDTVPRPALTPAEMRQLRTLADMTVHELAQRYNSLKSEQRRRRLQLAESIAGLGSWSLDLETGRVEWSEGMYDIYGLSPDAPLELDRLMAMIHPDDAAAAAARLEHQHLTGEGDPGSEARIIRPDGSLRHLENRSQVQFDETGQPRAIFGIVKDVTENRNAQKGLEDSERRYRQLADVSSDILVRLSPEGIVRYASPACRALGVTPEEAVGRPIASFISPRHLEQSTALFREILEGREIDHDEPRLNCLIDANGEEAWYEGSPSQIRDADGRVVEVVTVLRDVTRRVRIAEALAASEARYRRLADTAPDIISEADLDGRLTYISAAVREVLGFEPEALVGKSALSVLKPQDVGDVVRMCRAVIESDGRTPTRTIQYQAHHRDGRLLWLESHPSPMRDPRTGAISGFIDVVRDVTAQRELEASLREARNAAEAAAHAKSEFLANMSHELRTPLTAVIGFAGLAAAQPELSDRTRGFVGRMTTAGQALLAVVNDILDFSKLEAGQVEIRRRPVAPAALFADTAGVMEAAAADKGVRLVCDTEGLPPGLALDGDRLRQVLLNLVGNAVKFTDRGEVGLTARWADGWLEAEVRDQGCGIAPDKLAVLFQRFSQVDGSSTRRHGGTGLGLAICKGLVEAMGGTIGVESREGEGSRFTFRIPARTVEMEAAGVGEGEADLGELGIRLLVADDNAVNRELVEVILSPLGVEVSAARDGREAVEMAADMPFDVILMDLRMPRLDGPAAARAIRAGEGPNANIPIILFSADVTAADDPVFDARLAKPIEPAALLAAVCGAVAGPAPDGRQTDAA